ncbi:SEC7 domain-containing protein [Aphelenchoides fujianensis]|nr:SEC7 domain-containing protein [Aphelenchoides fujianensis]
MSNTYNPVFCEADTLKTLIGRTRSDGASATAEECNRLLTALAELRDVLTNRDLSFIRTESFLQPFLDVIQSHVTTDVATTRALQAVDKFINAGLIPSDESATKVVESIATVVTEAKFVESDYNKGDDVVQNMIRVLNSLLREPCGRFLKYEQICKMLHCLFRVCFDTSLNGLLISAARSALGDMTRILFTRSMTHNSEDVIKSMHELLRQAGTIIHLAHSFFGRRFSVSLANPLDSTNHEGMRMVGLNLVTIALETSIDHVCKYPNLVAIIKDDLCKSLLQLLNSPKIFLFSMANRLCYLLFTCNALRPQLKFQLESYFTTLMSIIGNELSSFDRKEIALESVVYLFRVPSLVSELYLNYDCGLYCSNLFEDLTKILSDNAFPTGGHILSTHLLSLEAILTVIGQICTNAVPSAPLPSDDYPEVVVHGGGAAKKHSVASPALQITSISEVITQKKQKRLITEGTELFNRSPKKGLEYLGDHGILKTPRDPAEVAGWLRANPHLDKMKIADCICDRKNEEILRAFVSSFPFEGTRLDEALRMFLESFRLPGESAEIEKVISQFAEHWFHVNNEPFAHPDSAFTLAYAVIMLNTDQHNPQVRRNQPPMSVDAFRKNLKGTNRGGDFDPDMLEEIYNSIKSNEIVMPAEQTGAIRENYLWKILQKRTESWEGVYQAATPGCNDRDLFNTIWGPATAALSYIFDRSEEKKTLLKVLNGYGNCATVAAYYGMTDVFDNLIIHLCKFSTLMGAFEAPSNLPAGAKDEAAGADGRHASSMRDLIANSPDQAVYAFGENYRAQIATRLMFELMRKHGDNLRAGWKNVLDCVLQLFRMRVLPATLTMAEDFVDPRGYVSIQRPKIRKSQSRQDFLRWLGFGSANDEPKPPTLEQEALKKAVITLVEECHPEELVAGGRHLTSSALDELVISIIHWSLTITGHYAASAAAPTANHHEEHAHEAADHSHSHSHAPPPPSIVPTPPATCTGEPQTAIVLSRQDEDELVFLLELLIRIAVENKYRIAQVWPLLIKHFHWLMFPFGRNLFVVERAVVGVMRVVNGCLLHLLQDRVTAFESPVLHSSGILPPMVPVSSVLLGGAGGADGTADAKMAEQLLAAVGMIGDLPPPALFYFSRQIACGLHQLLLTNAANIHSAYPWNVIFSLLQAVGAANYRTPEQNTLALVPTISRHNSDAFFNVCKTLGFLVQEPNAIHITAFNLDAAIECVRAMIEAVLDGGAAGVVANVPSSGGAASLAPEGSGGVAAGGLHAASSPASLAGSLSSSTENLSRPASPVDDAATTSSFVMLSDAEGAEEAQARAGSPTPSAGASTSAATPTAPADLQQPAIQPSRTQRYEHAAVQLATMCATLIAKCSRLQAECADGTDQSYASYVLPIYSEAFRMRILPLLQPLARMACDTRRRVRDAAFVELQAVCRALPSGDMQLADWEQMFGRLVFPLLRQLQTVPIISHADVGSLEELRIRVMQWAVRLVLNQLDTIAALPSFPILILRLIYLMERYIHQSQSELTRETIPQALKNMIQVLDNSRIFESQPLLHEEVKRLLNSFIPELTREIFAPPPPVVAPQTPPVQPAALPTIPTVVPQAPATPTPSTASIQSGPEAPQPPPAFSSTPAMTPPNTVPIVASPSSTEL